MTTANELKVLLTSFGTLLFTVIDWHDLITLNSIGDAIMWVFRIVLLIVTIRYTVIKTKSIKKPPAK